MSDTITNMSKPDPYLIISKDRMSDLEKAISLAIEDGYLLFGGVSLAFDRGNYRHYSQAVVRKGIV